MYAACPTHLILDLITLIILGEGHLLSTKFEWILENWDERAWTGICMALDR